MRPTTGASMNSDTRATAPAAHSTLLTSEGFLRQTRRAHCNWPARGIEVSIQMLPLTAHPQLSPDNAVMGGTSQADFLLAALGTKGVPAPLNCTRPAVGLPPDDAPHRLIVAQYWNWHSAASAGAVHGARGLQRAEAHYTALKTLMTHSGKDKPPAVLLMHASEWATDTVLLQVDRVLRQFAVDPSRVVFVHFNHGTMSDTYLLGKGARAPLWAPLQDWAARQGLRSRAAVAPIQQAYWQVMLWILASRKPGSALRHQQVAGRVCRPPRVMRTFDLAPPATPRSGRLDTLPPAPFLLLGGNPRYFRGLVLLDLARRGLLSSVGRWSSSRFGFCDGDPTRWVGQSGVSKEFFDGAGADARAPPFSQQQQRQLLGDATLVHSLCSLLPKVLDVAPDIKSDRKVLDSDDAIWRNVRFSLTFESDMAASDPGAELLFVTEKTIKPMQNGVPFIVLGSAGTLATLRSLGFRTFAPVINESYDDVFDGKERLQRALAEVERLTALPDAEWRELSREDGALADAVRHNLKHVVCGGFRRALAAHAVQLIARALRVRGAKAAKARQGQGRRGRKLARNTQ